ncbi:uncharacterized protein LOC141571268 [Rhinolophus sinicus]|uniref:uncharacterized protein LOC141571268 n=1 Tax=Rhinolophus sinicus TaxID=89399 RepID=UPI003D7A4AAA
MAQTEEHTVRGLTGSPRAEEGGGDSRAAPGYGQAVPLRSPSGSEVEGEWETGAETRDDPATAAPPPSHSASASPPRLIPPLSVDALPRPRPQVASVSAPWRPLSAVALRPRLPAPYPRARARPPPAPVSLRRSRERAPVLPALPPRPPFRGFRVLSGFSAQGRLSWTPPSTGEKSVGIRFRRVGRSVPRGPQNHGGIALEVEAVGGSAPSAQARRGLSSSEPWALQLKETWARDPSEIRTLSLRAWSLFWDPHRPNRPPRSAGFPPDSA